MPLLDYTSKVPYLKVADKSYCYRCAVRLGIFQWDGKRYVYKASESKEVT